MAFRDDAGAHHADRRVRLGLARRDRGDRAAVSLISARSARRTDRWSIMAATTSTYQSGVLLFNASVISRRLALRPISG
jgi:hypothetical protein